MPEIPVDRNIPSQTGSCDAYFDEESPHRICYNTHPINLAHGSRLLNPLGYTPQIESDKHRSGTRDGKAEVVKYQQLLEEIWNANMFLKHT